MKLVDNNDKILKSVAEKFDFSNPPFDPIEFSKEIVEFMHVNKALGLAAPQVGVPYQIFSLRGHPQNIVCFNPIIVHYSDDKIYLEEGCMSFPGLIVKVKRPSSIRIRYSQPNGEVVTSTYTGMTARVIQHEFDHLQGVLFYNKATKFHRDQAFRKWKNKCQH